MSALAKKQRVDREGLVAANEDVLEERVKSMQSNLVEVKGDLQVLRADNKRLDDRITTQGEKLSEKIDRKFDVLVAEQKDLRKEMAQGFEKVDSRFGKVEERFDKVDERFDKVEERFAKVEERFAKVEERFDKVNERFDKVTDRLDKTNERLDKVTTTLEGVRGSVKVIFLIASITGALVSIAGIVVGMGKALSWF